MKIRNWDTVVVLSGKEKTKTGKVLKVIPSTGRVVVEGINIVTRHMKKQWSTPGQIVKSEKSIDASNVALVCPVTEKPTRIGYVTVEEKGKTKKFRYSKKAVKEGKKQPKDCIIK